MMMRTLSILSCAALLMAGCRQPSDIELDGDETSSNLEAYAVSVPDTNIAVSSVDTTGVLPADEIRMAGVFMVNAVTWDAGTVKKSVAYSRAFFTDSLVRIGDKPVGFLGRDVGSVTLNGNLMVKVPHRILLRNVMDSSLVRGVEYLTDLTGGYQHDQRQTWVVYNRLVPVLTVQEETPEALTVTAPRGGTIHPRSQKLPVAWTGGKGKMSVIISSYHPITKRTRPLLELRVRTNNGRAFIPPQVLTQLPRGEMFVLTFVLANRTERSVTQPVNGRVLTQAAAVYNIFIELRG